LDVVLGFGEDGESPIGIKDVGFLHGVGMGGCGREFVGVADGGAIFPFEGHFSVEPFVGVLRENDVRSEEEDEEDEDVACHGWRGMSGVAALSFVGFYLVSVGEEVVDVVKSGDEAVFFVGVDVEMLAACGVVVGDGLCGEVDGEGGGGVLPEGIEEQGQEVGGDDDGEESVVEGVVLEDIGEEATHDGSKTCTADSPSGVFSAAAATEVLTGDEYPSTVSVLVEDEIGVGTAILVVSPVTEKVVAKAITRGSFEETCGDDLVGIDIFEGKGDAGVGEDGKLLFHICQAIVAGQR
jgi:hypothetical protein